MPSKIATEEFNHQQYAVAKKGNMPNLKKFIFKITIALSAMFFSCPVLPAAAEFPDKRLPVDENIWTSNEIVNAERGRDFVIRRLPKNNSPCNNADKCPPALTIDAENGNTDVKGKLNAEALFINGVPIVNQKGEWQGSTENLRGPQGEQGPKGDTGEGCTITQDSIICSGSVVTLDSLRGPKGDRGPQGIQGPQGIRGQEGAQGPQGDTGPVGPQGLQGLQGAKGDKGESCKIENGFIDCGGYKKAVEELRGPRGFQGEKGDKGESGLKGDKGDAGTKGDKGDKGDAGTKGDKGDKGDAGIKGDKGDKGDAGAKGDTGADGIQGDKGDKGDQGPKGSFAGCHSVYADSQLLNGYSVAAECPVGEIMTGGGCYTGAAPTDEVYIQTSLPAPEDNFYQCDYYAKAPFNGNTRITALAVCCKLN